MRGLQCGWWSWWRDGARVSESVIAARNRVLCDHIDVGSLGVFESIEDPRHTVQIVDVAVGGLHGHKRQLSLNIETIQKSNEIQLRVSDSVLSSNLFVFLEQSDEVFGIHHLVVLNGARGAVVPHIVLLEKWFLGVKASIM